MSPSLFYKCLLTAGGSYTTWEG